MSETIEWVDELPETRMNRYRAVGEFVEQLKANPGRWAKYWPVARSGIGSLRRSNEQRYPGTEWAVRDWELYGRWVGDDA